MDEADYLMSRMRLLAAALVGIGVLIALVHSAFWPSKPPPQTWADGVYYNDCCASIRLQAGKISSAGQSSTYQVMSGKRGYFIDVPAGISAKAGRVKFGGTLDLVQFNKDSDLEPAVHDAYALHIFDKDHDVEYAFFKLDDAAKADSRKAPSVRSS